MSSHRSSDPQIPLIGGAKKVDLRYSVKERRNADQEVPVHLRNRRNLRFAVLRNRAAPRLTSSSLAMPVAAFELRQRKEPQITQITQIA